MTNTIATTADRAFAAERTSPGYQAYKLLYFAFVAAPILAGLDKFLHLLTNWDKYLAPWIVKLSPIGGHNLMLAAGAVEMAAGVLVALKPRIGAPIVADLDGDGRSEIAVVTMSKDSSLNGSVSMLPTIRSILVLSFFASRFPWST